MRTASVLLAVVVVLVSAPACTDYEAGEKAYKQGDYATELKKLRPLAEQGDANMQFNLGLMYARGRGVPRDYAEAVRWYRQAAAQGDKRAPKRRDRPAKKMTPAQVAETQRLAREWRAKSK